MILDNFCCIGAELQNREVSQYKAPQLFYYRSANSSETMSVMLTAGFFNSIYQRVKVGDLILVYEPMNKQLQYIKITSNIGGVVGFETVAQSTITAEEVPVVPLSPFVSTNLQAMSDEVITKIGQMETEIAGKVSANNSNLTGTTTIASADITATDTDTLVVNTSTTLSGTTNTESISTTGNLSVSGNITAANITASTSMTVPTPVSDSNAATKKYVDDALAGFGGGYHPDLFDFEWTDKLKENMAWLRADTFSWQSGKTYKEAFLHLCKDILMDRPYIIPDTGLGSKFYRYPQNDTDTQFAWSQGFSTLYTDSEFPELGDNIYYYGTIAGVVDEFGMASSEYIVSDIDETKKYYRDIDKDDSVNGYYAWAFNSSTHLYTTSSTPAENDDVYTKSGGTYTVAGAVTESILAPTATTETISGNTITYYPTTDSHKIVLSDQESTVVSIFLATGVAWYYILDLTNIQFKLPRTKYGFTGLRDTVGKYVPAGLPNITGSAIFHSANTRGCISGASGALIAANKVNEYSLGTGNPSDNAYSALTLSASSSNSIYGNSTTVQPPATQMYLYFYVGEFTHSALENTAGLNADLFNNKLDTNALGLDATGKEYVSHLAMPSDTATGIVLGASGTSYTPNSNGYVRIDGTLTTQGAYIEIVQNTTDQTVQNSSSNNQYVRITVPVSKGYNFNVNYTGFSVAAFYFIYANGTK